MVIEDRRFKDYEGAIKQTTIGTKKVIMDRILDEVPAKEEDKEPEKHIIYFVDVIENEKVIDHYLYTKRKECSSKFRKVCKGLREQIKESKQEENKEEKKDEKTNL